MRDILTYGHSKLRAVVVVFLRALCLLDTYLFRTAGPRFISICSTLRRKLGFSYKIGCDRSLIENLFSVSICDQGNKLPPLPISIGFPTINVQGDLIRGA